MRKWGERLACDAPCRPQPRLRYAHAQGDGGGKVTLKKGGGVCLHGVKGGLVIGLVAHSHASVVQHKGDECEYDEYQRRYLSQDVWQQRREEAAYGVRQVCWE